MSSVVSQVPGFGKGGPERPLPVPSAPGISLFDDITWTGVNGLVVVKLLDRKTHSTMLEEHLRYNVVTTFA